MGVGLLEGVFQWLTDCNNPLNIIFYSVIVGLSIAWQLIEGFIRFLFALFVFLISLWTPLEGLSFSFLAMGGCFFYDLFGLFPSRTNAEIHLNRLIGHYLIPAICIGLVIMLIYSELFIEPRWPAFWRWWARRRVRARLLAKMEERWCADWERYMEGVRKEVDPNGRRKGWPTWMVVTDSGHSEYFNRIWNVAVAAVDLNLDANFHEEILKEEARLFKKSIWIWWDDDDDDLGGVE